MAAYGDSVARDGIGLPGALGGVDEFEQVAGGSDLDHAEEAFSELVVSGSDRAIGLEMNKTFADTIALLVEGCQACSTAHLVVAQAVQLGNQLENIADTAMRCLIVAQVAQLKALALRIEKPSLPSSLPHPIWQHGGHCYAPHPA